MRPFLVPFLVAFALTPCAAPAATSPWPAGVHLPAGQPIDEEYRGQFGSCDRHEAFRGHQTHGCGADPNQVTALRRLPNGSVAYVSKLAVDLDGSAFACGPDHGRSDQCSTSLMLPDGKGGEIPVDADSIPYVVIPEAGPPDVAGEFTRVTGVQVGDFGIVIANGRMVPVIVADTGPFAKLGEGSLALHRALGRELCVQRDEKGVCRRVVDQMESIEGNVTTILFPGTARHDLTPANIASIVREQGRSLWAKAAPPPSEHPRHGSRLAVAGG
jgi:hypothetical protein